MTRLTHSLTLLGLILGTCFVHSSLVQRNIDPEIQKQIDDFINDVYLPHSQISSMGLTIVKDDGQLLYTTGYGFADHEKGIPNGNQTQFLIGSTTKSFTSAIIIKTLHQLFPELGETVLDTPIRKLLPSANFTLSDRFRSEHATFRDLIAHRMCLFRDDLQLISEPFETASEVVYRQRYAEEICGIRSEFQYNNQMYVIAGELIGLLANKSYTELMNDLLEEIGMNGSALTSKSDDFSNMPFRGQPHYVMDNVSYPINTDLIKRVTVSNPAGGLYATPNDFVRYLRFHLNKGSIDGKQIIPQEVMAWMTKPAAIMLNIPFKQNENDIVGHTFGYGLGLMLAAYDGFEYVHHGGYFPPYHTLMSLFPTQNLGIFTSTNEGLAYVDASVLHAFIFEVLRGSSNAKEIALQQWSKMQAIKEEKKSKKEKVLDKFLNEKKNLSPIHSAEDIVGKYGSGGSGDIEILEKFNNQTNATGLYLSYGKWYQGWLEYVGESVYQISYDTDIVQDNYAAGEKLDVGYVRVDENNTLEVVSPSPNGMVVLGKFKLGVSLDILPPVPWAPDSCGPASMVNQ